MATLSHNNMMLSDLGLHDMVYATVYKWSYYTPVYWIPACPILDWPYHRQDSGNVRTDTVLGTMLVGLQGQIGLMKSL